jgi:hypothetical protein
VAEIKNLELALLLLAASVRLAAFGGPAGARRLVGTQCRAQVQQFFSYS